MSGRSFAPDRRQALALLSSSIAATLTRCGQPDTEIVPYVNMPEGLTPGVPRRYATALPLAGYGRGALGISVDGRPIKIEGNPRHPYSLGATDVFMEAEVLSLYGPDRSRTPLKQRSIASWQAFTTDWTRWAEAEQTRRGAGMALVTGRITSPTMTAAIGALTKRFPALRHYRYEPAHDDAERAGARLAFGRVLESIPDFASADVVVALDGDPLGHGPALLRNARGFSEARGKPMRQRLYVAESSWSLTGAMADHRIAAAPGRVTAIAAAIASGTPSTAGTLSDSERRFADAAQADLMATGKRGLVLAGPTQPPEIHALAHWINGQVHAPVTLIAPVDAEEADHGESFSDLLNALSAGRIRTLIVIDSNPVYDAPDSARVAEAIKAVPFSIHCGLQEDETAEQCRWHLALSHPLENWGDIRSVDGTASIVQPLIRPLYDARTEHEIVAMLAGAPDRSAYDSTRATWMPAANGDFDTWWRQVLRDGVVPMTAASPVTAQPKKPALRGPAAEPDSFILTIAPDPSLWDGRYAGNAWLQETPEPFTKQTWGNAVTMSPADADKLGVTQGDIIAVKADGAEVELMVTVATGHADGVLSTRMGHGRWRAGVIGSGIGARVAPLRGNRLDRLVSASARKTGERGVFRTTQRFTQLEGDYKDLYPYAALSRIGERIAELEPERKGLLGPFPPSEYAWAMVIDNDVCIGCNACVVACQSENNIGTVGPEEIARGRIMHWLRIDAYDMEEAGERRRGFQPIPCMHCETAPCEPVCPVEASVHDHDGLNVQVYNRCIGTRFCESNCPYKVRRFNFFAYTHGQEYGNLGDWPSPAHRNPNVSVRGRGVMEKCTYCVQRIEMARHHAGAERREIGEGEIVTACQAACPTRAIHFGDRNRADSEVAKLQTDRRHYALLGHLDTRPRTTYLAKAINPNPALDGAQG